MSHGSQADHLESYRRVRAGSDATGRSVGVLADLQGPKIRLGEFPGGPVRLTAGDEFTITTERHPRRPARGVHHLRGPAPTTCGPGDRILIDDGNVQLDVTGVTGNRVRPAGRRRREGLRPQGHQPAGCQRQRARAHRQGRGRPALGAGDRRGHRRDVLRPHPGRRAPGPQDHDRHGPLRRPADRQDREAGGGRRAAGHRGRLRRDHGGPRRPRRRAAARAGARRADPGDQPGQGAGPPGHRGHPDARVDDQRAASDPGRGLRRGRRGRRRARTR